MATTKLGNLSEYQILLFSVLRSQETGRKTERQRLSPRLQSYVEWASILAMIFIQ